MSSREEIIPRLLLSRKRKLSELYYATVSCGDLDSTTKNPLYQERERLFLDANDIQKGRLFDISTLPPPPHIIPPPKPERLSQSNKTLYGTHDICQPSLKSGTPPSGRPASPKPPTTDPARPASPSSGRGSREITPDQTGDGNKQQSLRSSAGLSKDEVQSANSEPDEQINTVTTLANSTQQQAGLGLRCNDNISSNSKADFRGAESDGEMHLSSFLQPSKSERARSPLEFAPITTAADPQSSPASTNGAVSSNTPDPAVGSPTTSPGEEQGVEELDSFGRQAKRQTLKEDVKPTEPSQHPSRVKRKPPDDAASMQPPPDVGQNSVPRQTTGSVHGKPEASTALAAAAQKPSMRIDTQTITSFGSRPKETSSVMESPMALTSAFTPGRAPSSATFSAGQSPPGRITRISSGTIRHRSVSEILGEVPKPSSPALDKTSNQTTNSAPLRDPFEVSILQTRPTDRTEREKDRNKLSTVVFAKQQRAFNFTGSTEPPGNIASDLVPSPPERDYLHTLFESKAYSPPRGHPLNVLLQSAHKSLSTTDQLIDYQEQMNCRTLKRIYQLQNANRWPLRQMVRVAEPVRRTSHWDFVLDHAKWMRTDYREERKWKLAASKGLAEWCAEWISSPPRRRQQLQVKVRPSPPVAKRANGGDRDAQDHFPAVPSPPSAIS